MIKVFVRDINESRGRFLGNFEPQTLPQIVFQFENGDWGIDNQNGENCEFDTARFVLYDECIFEIVIAPVDTD